MASVGSVKRPYHYTKALEKIRPKHLRLLAKPVSVIERIHGKHTGGIALHGKKVDTIVVPKTILEQNLAHEFAHVALGHYNSKGSTIGDYVRDELEAWQWIDDNWKIPNKMIGQRKWWLETVIGQTMHEQHVPLDASIKIAKHQMRLLKQKPMTEAEEKYCRTELKVWEKKIRKEGWEPEDVTETSREKE